MADYTDLKNKFKTDDVPTGSDYDELIQLAGDAKDTADSAVPDNGDGSVTINSKKVTPASVDNVVIDNKDNTITVNNKVYAPVIDNQDGTITVNTQTYEPVKKSDYASDKQDFVVKSQLSIPQTSFMDIGTIPEDMKSGIKDFVSRIDNTKFNMLWISDSHYENLIDPTVVGSYQYGGRYALNHAAIAEYISNYVDVVIAGGDNTNGIDNDLQHSISDAYLYSSRLIISSTGSDKFLLLGNHDDGSPIAAQNISVYPDMVMTNSDFENAFMTNDLNFGEVRNNGSLYFYKDYPDSKIRVIGLNSLDIPYTMTNPDGTSKYTRWLDYAYNQEQLDWVANTALKVPSGYGVIFCTHVPLTHGYSPISKVSYHNFDVFENLMNLFSKGLDGSLASPSGTPDEFKVNINASFSSQGPRDIIGIYGGHIHSESMSKLANFTQLIFLADVNNASQNIGTINELGMAVIQVDVSTKKVSVLGLGRSTDRDYTYGG